MSALWWWTKRHEKIDYSDLQWSQFGSIAHIIGAFRAKFEEEREASWLSRHKARLRSTGQMRAALRKGLPGGAARCAPYPKPERTE